MTSADTSTTDEEIAADLARAVKLERRLIRDQSRAERRLARAARRNLDAEERLSRARSKVARAETVAAERKGDLEGAIEVVSAARAAREAGEEPKERVATGEPR